VAGFIGSNLLESLLKLDQRVVGWTTSRPASKHNLDQVEALVGPERWKNFRSSRATSARWKTAARRARAWTSCCTSGPRQRAALDRRSDHQPREQRDRFLNMLVAARDAKVKRFVYAASSAAYGDHRACRKSSTPSAARSRRTARAST
jgi:UDP-N-acetylglucosamine 4-epimerase